MYIHVIEKNDKILCLSNMQNKEKNHYASNLVAEDRQQVVAVDNL